MAIERWNTAQTGEKRSWENNSYKNTFYGELKMLEQLNIKTENKKLLEIGGGATELITLLNGEKHSIDPLMNFFLSEYSMPKNVNHIQGMGENIPFKNNFFNFIFCINALDHSEDPIKVVEEINRTLDDKGILFLRLNCYHPTTTKIRNLSERMGAGDLCHPYSFSIEDMKELLSSKGFEEVKIAYGQEFENPIVPPKEKKKSLIKRITNVINLGGVFYLIKRLIVLPLNKYIEKKHKGTNGVFFIYKKINPITKNK